jgi:pyruvate,water dikinase
MTKHQTIVLDDSNIVESYPGITLPLTESFVKSAYHEIFRGALLRLTGSQKIVEQDDNNLQNMLASYNGKIYYQINNWYSVIRYLPFSHRVIPIWQEMMGVKKDDGNGATGQRHKASIWRKAILSKNVISGIIKTPQEMKNLETIFSDVEKYFSANYGTDLDNQQLRRLYETLFHRVLAKWDVTLANDLYAFVFTGLVKRRLGAANQYIASSGHIESMKPLRTLLGIVQLTVESRQLNKLMKLKTDADVSTFLASKTELTNRINRYIAKFGDRYLDELKLESPTYRTKPKLLIDRIIEYANNYIELSRTVEKVSPTKPKSDWLTEKFLNMAITGIKNREASRLNRARLYGMVRTIFMSIGENMVRDRAISSPTDIFYLTIPEVFDHISGDKAPLARTIAQRKEAYAAYADLPTQHRLIFIDGKLQNNPSGPSMTDELLGVPVSSGTVTAEAVIINDPRSVGDIDGKILVAHTTDPAWAFLLVRAAGIITERGSLLSHTAIIARELNVPAIVSVPNATSLLKPGDIVTMDCTTGRVERKHARS